MWLGILWTDLFVELVALETLKYEHGPLPERLLSHSPHEQGRGVAEQPAQGSLSPCIYLILRSE